MKKILLTLSSVLLFAASLSAQIQIDSSNALPTSGTVFGKDEVRTVKYDSLYMVLNQRFDSAGHNFISGNFDGYGGAFVYDTSNSLHSNHLFITNDGSGFVLMDAEAAANDTQRVTLTSPAFSTIGYSIATVSINHHYKYSVHDSAALLMASTNGTTWTVLTNFSAAAMDRGTSLAFATDMTDMPAQFLNKATVYLRMVYATDSGYQWAINEITVTGNKFTPGYDFFKPATNHMWDLTNIEYDGGVKYYSRKSAPNPYRYGDSLYNEHLKGLQHTTYELNYFTLSGIYGWAHLTYDQLIPLQGLDTMLVPVQSNIQHSAAHIKMVYPCTYGTKWMSNFWYMSTVQIKGPGLGASQFGGNIGYTNVNHYTEVAQRDTVTGWGKMRVKTPDGGIQGYIDVLQVKSKIRNYDSFYLQTLGTDSLSNVKRARFNQYIEDLGLGSPSTVNQYNRISYYRIGEIHPLVTVFMTDTFVNRIEVHVNHPWPLDVATATGTQQEFKVYPNPVTGRVVNVGLAVAQDGNWTCDVLNVMGQVVTTQRLDFNMGNTTDKITLPATAAPGNYYLRLTKDGQLMTVKQVVVQD